MTAKDHKSRLFLYRTLMAEIKERVSYIDGATNKTYNLPDLAAYELCHVQIRLICELIATACLLAHGDIPAAYTKRLLSTYEPHRIFAELEHLHPDFYPRACGKEVELGPPLTFSVLPDDSFLPKEKLITLHGLTGNVLHSRRVRDIGEPYQADFAEVEKWKHLIVGQLRVHMISHLNRENFIICMMNDPNTGGPSTIEGKRTFASPGWEKEQAQRFAPKDRKSHSRRSAK